MLAAERTIALRRVGILTLAAIAFISVVQGFRNALRHSQDFQWSPSHLFSQRINPYEVYLGGNIEGTIILSQAPNYLHELYVLLIPLGFLEFETAKVLWAIINIALALAVCRMVAARYDIGKTLGIVLTLIFLCSTPFRNGIGNGQHALLILFCILLPSHRSSTYSWIITGMAWAKYSFAPTFLTFIFFRYGAKKAILTLLFPVAGLLSFSFVTAENPFDVLFQPILVAQSAASLGVADLMSIIERQISQDGHAIFTLTIPSLLATFLGFLSAKARTEESALAMACLASLMTLKHLGYDYVFLLPVAAFTITLVMSIKKIVLAVGIFWFWFGAKIVDEVTWNIEYWSASGAQTILGFAILLLSFLIIYFHARPKKLLGELLNKSPHR